MTSLDHLTAESLCVTGTCTSQGRQQSGVGSRSVGQTQRAMSLSSRNAGLATEMSACMQTSRHNATASSESRQEERPLASVRTSSASSVRRFPPPTVARRVL
jgi:hypothetical protein